MSAETAADRAGLRRAGRVVAETIAAMRVAVRPGVTTGAIDAIAAEVLAAHGARSAPQLVYRFPGTTCISVNDEAVHGVPGPRILQAGDLITLDVTVELDGYMADAAVTVPVGAASPEAVALVRAAEQAFWTAAGLARAGTPLRWIGRSIEASVEASGFRVLRALSGHGIGRTIHEPPDVPNFDDRRTRGMLTDGLVLAIEPIICARTRYCASARGAWPVRSADGSLTAHFEHTLMIQPDGCEILTALPAA